MDLAAYQAFGSEPAPSRYSPSGSRYLLADFAVGSSAPAVEPWAGRFPAGVLGIAGVVLILTGAAGRLKCSTAADPPGPCPLLPGGWADA